MCHAECSGEFDRSRAWESLKPRVEQGRQDLPDAVGAKIRHDQTVAVVHAGIAAERRRWDELVALPGCVGLRDRALGIGRVFAFGFGHRIVSALDAIPALVPIHREISAPHGGNADIFETCQSVLELGKMRQGASRRRVAPIEKRVDRHRDSRRCHDPRERRDVILVRVDTAGRQQSQNMRRAPGLFQRGNEGSERGIVAKLPFLIARSMRGNSCMTTRPAPRFM